MKIIIALSLIAAVSLTACSTTNQQIIGQRPCKPCVPCKCSKPQTNEIAAVIKHNKAQVNSPTTLPKTKISNPADTFVETSVSTKTISSFVVIQ